MTTSDRSLYRRALLGSAAAFAVAGLISLRMSHAGGWALTVDVPRADQDARHTEYALIVRAVGCGGPGSQVTATAEGLVDGKRVSRTLEMTDLSTNYMPVYGLRRTWPTEGRWTLAFRAKRNFGVYKNDKPTGEVRAAYLNVLVPLAEDGTPMTRQTPGAKYPTFLKTVPVAEADREKQIKLMLVPTTVTAQAK